MEDEAKQPIEEAKQPIEEATPDQAQAAQLPEPEPALPQEPAPTEPADGADHSAPPETADALVKKQEDNIMAVIESLLFAYEKPLTIEQIKKVLDTLDAGQIRKSLEKLTGEYEAANRGMRIIEVAGGYKMISAPHFASFLRKLFKGPQSNEKLSGPSMETLAIIAYKQPISKLEIESLRKVNTDGVMQTLIEKNLVRVTGRKDAPGRPKVYGTTKEFLEYFGLKSLEDLPKLEHFPLSPDKQREILEKFTDNTAAVPADAAPAADTKTDGHDIAQETAPTN